MFLILFRNILCPQQMFPGLRAQGNVMSKYVSATMFENRNIANQMHGITIDYDKFILMVVIKNWIIG